MVKKLINNSIKKLIHFIQVSFHHISKATVFVYDVSKRVANFLWKSLQWIVLHPGRYLFYFCGLFIRHFPNLLLLSIVVFLVWVTLREVDKNLILIEPFEMPESFKAQGHNGRVIANKLMDKINHIEKNSKIDFEKSLFSFSWILKETEVIVPGVGISLSNFSRFIRKLFADLPFFKHGKEFVIGGYCILYGKDHEQCELFLRINRSTSKSFSINLTEFDKSLLLAAEHICLKVEPFILANYQFVNDKTDNKEHVIKTLTYAVNNPPRDDDAKAYKLWSYILYLGEDYGGSIDKLQRAIEIEPKDYISYNNLGNLLNIQKKYDEAIQNLRISIRLKPENPMAYTNLGIAYGNQNNYEEANAKFKKAIKFAPNYYLAYHNWGNNLNGQKSYDEAIEKFRKAIEINPNFAPPYSAWGDALVGKQEYENAISKYMHAKKIDRKEEVKVNLHIASAYTNWGFQLGKQNKYDEAIDKFKKAIEVDQNFATAYNLWGIALEKKEEYQDAIIKYQKAIEIDPDLKNEVNPSIAKVYNNMGVSLMEGKKYNAAINKFKTAIEFDSYFAAPYHNSATYVIG